MLCEDLIRSFSTFSSPLDEAAGALCKDLVPLVSTFSSSLEVALVFALATPGLESRDLPVRPTSTLTFGSSDLTLDELEPLRSAGS